MRETLVLLGPAGFDPAPADKLYSGHHPLIRSEDKRRAQPVIRDEVEAMFWFSFFVILYGILRALQTFGPV